MARASAHPTISSGGNPTNQSVPAGQPVTFTAAASGNPTPTVQWFEGGHTGATGVAGTGMAVSGATSTTLTFTTSSTAADNGNSYYAEFTNSQARRHNGRHVDGHARGSNRHHSANFGHHDGRQYCHVHRRRVG